MATAIAQSIYIHTKHNPQFPFYISKAQPGALMASIAKVCWLTEWMKFQTFLLPQEISTRKSNFNTELLEDGLLCLSGP